MAHYTGRIIYDTRAFTDINRDFVPPEMIETFRSSCDENIMIMFTNQLTKAGNLTMNFEVQRKSEDKKPAYVNYTQINHNLSYLLFISIIHFRFLIIYRTVLYHKLIIYVLWLPISVTLV